MTNPNEQQAKPVEKNWYKDKYQFVLVQRNILVVVTLFCLGAALLGVLAVQHLAPLKTVEPFIIQVDQKSGLTEVVEPISRAGLTGKEVLDNYFIWQYVRARETFSSSDLQRNKNVVRVLSSQKEYKAYTHDMDPRRNPDSPHAILKGGGVRILKYPTIVYLSDAKRKVAQVRFVMEQRDGRTVTSLPKIATIEYEYYDLNLKRNERLINPLGFQVEQYRVDEEVVSGGAR